MTSGVFETVPIDSIWVERSERQRRELTDIDDLAESIRDRGLIHPPVVTRELKLIAGERRWTACKQLGWTSIPVQYIESESDEELEIVELHENLKRQSVTWQEQVLATQRLHEALSRHNTDWSREKTAKFIGVSQIDHHLAIADQLQEGNELVVNAPTMSAARNVTVRLNQRREADTVAAITGATPVVEDEVQIDPGVAPSEKAAKALAPFKNADFVEWAAAYKSTKFNFIHCDFPYGINADKHDQSGAHLYGGYADDFATYEKLCDALANAMNNVVADSAHLMFWFSMDHYQWTKERLEAMGWKVNPFPLIWFKSDGRGVLPDFQRGPRRTYETAFLASRNDRFVVQAVNNCTAHPNKKEIHMSEKPREMLRHFFRMFVGDTTIMLDPTAGSGNAVRVAADLGAKKVLGIEREKEFYEDACRRYLDVTE